MSYLFDASSIFDLIRINHIEPLSGSFTNELARYELGNIIWKEHKLHRKMDAKTAAALLTDVKSILATMKVLELYCHEEEVEEFGHRLGISFYDASYAFQAKAKAVTMVTDDTTLAKKLAGYVRTMSSRDLINPSG